MSRYPLGRALVVSLGGFVFGNDLGALSSATQSLRSQFHLSPANFGVTVSFSLWGTVMGSLVAGRLADQMSRRRLIAGCAMLYSLGAIGVILPLPPEWALILAMRFLCGMAIGGFTVGCPLYLAELAPIDLRGRLVSLFQLQVGAGVVVGFGAGSLFAHLCSQRVVWKWCLGAAAVPASALLVLLWSTFDRGTRLSQGSSSKGCGDTSAMPLIHNPSNPQRLFCRRNLRPILLATSIAFFNQLSGVNIVLLYMLDIFSSAGISFDTKHAYTILISALNLLTTILGMAYVDRAGRKPLLYVGSAGMAICLLCLAVVIPHHFGPLLYFAILVAYNAFFAFSQGTVVWVYLSELFPPGVRGAGQGYGSTVHWIASATLVLAFPIMQHVSSVLMFYLFALMMSVQIVVIRLWYPETRGATLGSFPAQNA